jgi:hypothetical protein
MPSLTVADLTAARVAYEAGQTFAAIGQGYGVPESTMRRLLRAVGIEPRPRGIVPVAIPPIVLEEARAGMSAHQLARKHKLPRHRINAALREQGLARAPRQRVLEPLGRKVTDLHWRQRQRTPMAIPMRTAEQRRVCGWTAPELAAIEQALQAGRFTVAPRGRSGLPERHDHRNRQAASFAFVIAMSRVRRAA